jgi:hypothetical protein
VINADQVPDAVKALHEAFDLDSDSVRREDPTGTEHRPTVEPGGDDGGSEQDAA